MAGVEVLVKQVEPIIIAGAREVVSNPALMRERCIALNSSACDLINLGQLKTDGISFALYYNSDERGIDVEMAYAVESAGSLDRTEKATIHTLPAATVAYAVFEGSYNDYVNVGNTHMAIVQWMVANRYTMVGPCREYYLQPPQSADNSHGVMEIQYPMEKM